jgi:outer membrane protein assembly factor BamB
MPDLAVVPIFMSAGAAVLPTILAGATSVIAIILKPKLLFQLIRQRPKMVGAVAGIVIALCLGIGWLLSGTPARAGRNAGVATVVHYDWAKIAEEILAQDKAGKAPTVIAAGESTDAPIVLGRDYSRCGYDGGLSPAQLSPLWSYGPEDTMFLSIPVVAGKRIFVAGCQADVSRYTGMLVCLDAETGKSIWPNPVVQVKDDVLPPFFSSPALTKDGKYLLIGGGLHDDHDCSLRCFDAATGEQRWAVKTTLHIESSPAIFGDIVVAGAGAIEDSAHKATGDPGHVIAVRISDGKELWRQPVNDPESSPAIDNEGMVYIGSGFNGNAIVAIRSAPDEELREKKLDRIAWHTAVSQPVTSTITIAGDLVIAGAGNSDFVYADPNPDGFVVALDRKTGQIRWQTKFPDAVLGQICFRDGKLICPVRTGEVAALDVTDGHVLWRAPISGKAPVLAGCAFTGKAIYAVSSDGYLARLEPADGKLLEKVYLNDQGKAGTGKSLCGPQVVNGRVIVGSETGGLRCYVGARNAE